MLGAAVDGPSCCHSSPANPAKLTEKKHTPVLANRKWVEDSRWGLSRGLRRGLGPGLIMITSGMLEVLARGSSPIEVLALFSILYASVSVSLQKQAKTKLNQAR